MNKLPKISIITVSYNSQSTIAHTINSVASQDYDNIEYIIIDGCSNDWTLNIIEQHSKKINYFVSEKDDGIYDAMNKGIKVATGDIIGILNSDDFYPNNTIISEVVKEFSKSNCDCLYGDLVYVQTANPRKIVRYWKTGRYSYFSLKSGWMLPHPTLFVKKEVYKKYGLYNTELSSASDYEMILRLLLRYKLKVTYIPMILVKMRQGGRSNATFLNRFIANKEDGLAWKLNKLSPPPFIRITKPLRKLKQFFIKP